jgi:hypothetical protein
MAGDSASPIQNDFLSPEVENKKLLGNYDDCEEDSELAWTWTGKGVLVQSRKMIPRPSTMRGWIVLSLLVAVALFLGAAFGYLSKSGCTEQQCIRMTSSYCEWLLVP